MVFIDSGECDKGFLGFDIIKFVFVYLISCSYII